jgi:hypothetical protein
MSTPTSHTCPKCESPNPQGYCEDLACPYSDNPKEIPYEELTTGELHTFRTSPEVQEHPQSRSISDDDLCSDCAYLLYCPGYLSLCRRASEQGFPGKSDTSGYVIKCGHYLPADCNIAKEA